MKKLVWIVIGIFLASTATRFVVLGKNERALKNYQASYTLLEDQGTFVETLPREFAPDKRYDQIVLLLHGYGTSPQTFKEVCNELEGAKIPYYCPQIIGHGLEDTHLMEALHVSDWKRQVVTTYDFLSKLAKKVSVVGYSNGGSLGCYLAQTRLVDTLILIAPAIQIGDKGVMADKVLRTSFLGDYIKYIFPRVSFNLACGKNWMQPDAYHDDRISSRFIYNYYDMNSFKALFDLQKSVCSKDMNENRELYLLLMKRDKQVNNKKIESELKYRKYIPTFYDSGHAWEYSSESKRVARDIVAMLKGEEK